jgi:hypothetical protein
MVDDASAVNRAGADDPDDAGRLQQYEIVWVLPRQYHLANCPEGFALEIIDFLGPGDPDYRGEPTVWVRGPVVEANLRRGESVTVAIPHDQPRTRRGGSAVLLPPIPGVFEHHDPQRAARAGVTG